MFKFKKIYPPALPPDIQPREKNILFSHLRNPDESGRDIREGGGIKNDGQVLLISVFLLFLVAAYGLILIDKVINSIKINRIINYKSNALWLAEAGVQKAIWCLNSASGENCGESFGDDYLGENNVDFGEGIFTTILSGTGTSREIISVGAYKGVVKTARLSLIKAPKITKVITPVAILAGNGGIDLSSNVSINGDLDTQGDLVCASASSSIINGDATVAGENEVNKCKINGAAKANIIKDSVVSGDGYYQTLINSTIGGIKYPNSPNPTFGSFPITDEMINQWKSDAAAGAVYVGNYAVDSKTYLGPLKITGDLEVKSNKTLTITGTIYVQGKVLLNSNADIVLHPVYGKNSGLIITDKKIISNSNVEYVGTPEGGQITFIATGEGEDGKAMELSSNIGAASFYAPLGEIYLKSGNQIWQVVGKKIKIDSNSVVTYNPDAVQIFYIKDIVEPTFWQSVPGSRVE